MRRFLPVALTFLAFSVATVPAHASFHFMQIEQVLGGVNGNTGIQAVQLRMRSAGQSQMQFSRLYAWDAQGLNPVLLIDFITSVTNGSSGARVLAATAGFQAATSTNMAPDVIMSPIPSSYLQAGSITFEDDGGTVYWRVSWGGAAYSGSGSGTTTNDADGNFNPSFPGSLLQSNGRALQFTGIASALSTNNAAQYAYTAGPATFTRNNGNTGQIVSTVGVGDESVPSSIALGSLAPNPVATAVSFTVSLPRAARVDVRAFDLRGRAVADVMRQDLPAGRHQFTWDIASASPALASGVYFLVLEAEGHRSSQRVAYLKGSPPVFHHDEE